MSQVHFHDPPPRATPERDRLGDAGLPAFGPGPPHRRFGIPPSRGAGPRARGRMRSLLAAARMVPGVTAGTVLRRDGRTQPLPGVDGDALLIAGSPVLSVAHVRIAGGQLYSSFLWPRGGEHAPGGHARVTVLAVQEGVPARVTGVVLLSPTPDVHGLTPRELEVLGLVVDGCSNQEIARSLVVAPRTAATHVEHVLVKLGVATRTLAAVRAEREGLYVPAASQRQRCLLSTREPAVVARP